LAAITAKYSRSSESLILSRLTESYGQRVNGRR